MPAISMAVCIIPDSAEIYNENRPFFGKKLATALRAREGSQKKGKRQRAKGKMGIEPRIAQINTDFGDTDLHGSTQITINHEFTRINTDLHSFGRIDTDYD